MMIHKKGEGIHAHVIGELIRLGVAQGAPPHLLLRAAGEFDTNTGRFGFDRAAAIWNLLANTTSGALGIRFGVASTTSFGAMADLIHHARTAREALSCFATMLHRFTSEGSVTVTSSYRSTCVELHGHTAAEALGHPIDFIFVLLIRMLGHPKSASIVREASFSHCGMAPQTEYEPHFGSRLQFDAPTSRLVLDNAALDRSYQTLDQLLDFDRRLDTIASPRHAALDSELSQAVVRTTDRGNFEVEAVARELGVSPRSLQRRANKAGVGLREMLRSAREHRAIELLRDRSLSVSEIADHLDYSDERSFSRAFERWTGKTPARWRVE